MNWSRSLMWSSSLAIWSDLIGIWLPFPPKLNWNDLDPSKSDPPMLCALAPFEELQTCCTFGLKMVVLQKQYLVRLRWLWQLRQKGAAGQTNQAKILKKTTVIIEQVSLSNSTAAPPIFRCKFNLWHTKFWKRNFLSTCKMISFAHGVLSP